MMQKQQIRAFVWVICLCRIVVVDLMIPHLANLSAQELDAEKHGRQIRVIVSRPEIVPTLQRQRGNETPDNSKEARHKSGNVHYRSQDERYPEVHIGRRDGIQALLDNFPDLSRAYHLIVSVGEMEHVPDRVLEHIAVHGKNLRALILRCAKQSDGKPHQKITNVGMAHISRIEELDTLCLSCGFSAKGFRHLCKLKKLTTLGLEYPTISARDFFKTIATMPSIRSVGVEYADFLQPIDTETYRAIASLRGRLEHLSFGEWGETKIHWSYLPAICEIESLISLEFEGMNPRLPNEPVPDCLKLPNGGVRTFNVKRLPYLQQITPCEPLAAHNFGSRDTYPVEFRAVESASGMIALLNFLLGKQEAAKVRRKVVRRRAGLSDLSEDFTKSKLPVGQILNESFGVSFHGSTWGSLLLIESSYPELNKQLRRYLSGKDLKPSKVGR